MEDKRPLPRLVASPLHSQRLEPLSGNKTPNKKTPQKPGRQGRYSGRLWSAHTPAGWAEASRVGSRWFLFAADFQDVNRDVALRCASAALREDLFRETSEAVSLGLGLTAPCPKPPGSGPSLDAPLCETAGGRVSPAASVGGGFRGPRNGTSWLRCPLPNPSWGRGQLPRASRPICKFVFRLLGPKQSSHGGEGVGRR